MNNKIAVLGDKDSILAFKAIGLEVFPITNDFQARDLIKKLAKRYAVIFVTEKVAESVADIIQRYKAQAYPAIIPIPSAEGTTGFGINGIKNDVEKAIGADILFNKDK